MQSIAVFFLIALPWMNPFAPGPTPAAVPLLFSWACAALLVVSAAYGPKPWTATRLLTVAAWAWFAAGLFSSLMGLLQYFGAADLFLPWINQTRPGEAFANLRQRNHFASLCNIALTAVFFMAAQFTSPAGNPEKLASRHAWWLPLAATVLSVGNATSSSRTGTLQLLMLCGAFWWWGGSRQPHAQRVVLSAALAYAAATLLLPWLAGFGLLDHGVAARFRAGDEVCASRLTLWSNVLQLIAQKPWSGWGWGELDYAHYTTLYPGPRFCEILDNAHNLPLHLAVELGIPVAVLACAAVVWFVLRRQPWRETVPVRQMAWAVLGVVMLHSLLEYPLWYGPFQMAVVLCLLLLWPPSASPATQVHPRSGMVATWLFRAVLPGAVLIATVYAGLDYHRISQIYLPQPERAAAYRTDTLSKIRGVWLFRNQVQFAELNTTALTRDNAEWSFDTAASLLHYSPEPRVIEKLIESAVMLGRDDVALWHLVRYRAAFPVDYARWKPVTVPLLEKLPLSP